MSAITIKASPHGLVKKTGIPIMSKTDHARSRISHHDMIRVGPEQVLTSGTDVATHSETTKPRP